MPTGIWNPENDCDDQQTREKMLQSLLDSVLEGETSRAGVAPRHLARRELPPGNWSSLYLLYLAHCKSRKEKPASRSTFYSVVKGWKCCLRFRKKSAHTACHICDLWRSRMRHAKDFWKHASACDGLLGHLQLTWRCRQKYWQARAMSRSRQNDLLSIIVVSCLVQSKRDRERLFVCAPVHQSAPQFLFAPGC